MSSIPTQLNHCLPLTDAASDAELERQEHPLERTTVVCQDDALTQMDDANTRFARGIGSPLPRAHDVGDEA